MEKFNNEYRIPSNRKSLWNYAWDGVYFITICTQNRECNLGEIINGEMHLSDFGKIASEQWIHSFSMRAELSLIEWVIMPNHIHAVIALNCVAAQTDGLQTDGDCGRGDIDGRVKTHGRASLPSTAMPPSTPHHNMPIRQPRSISSFVAGFKSAVNSKIDDFIDENHLDISKYNRNNHFFQPNYHDHIIKNQYELENIVNYIISNPIKWEDDSFFRTEERP